MDAGRSFGSRLVAEVADAQREERTRLADALHDDALQLLLLARQQIAELVDDPPAATAAELRRVGRVLADVERSLRVITTARHDAVTDAGLDRTLSRIADEAASRGRLRIELEIDPSAAGLHDEIVCGWVRELLQNAVKHAAATAVVVAIRCVGTALEVSVADDGRGFGEAEQLRARERGHVGFERLRRTVAGLSGALRVADAAPGARVLITVPLAALTSQHSAEQALGAERRWTGALVAALQEPFAVVRDGVVVQVNDRFCATTGFPRSALVGVRAVDVPLWGPGRQADGAERFRQALREGGGPVEVELIRADGSAFPASGALSAVDDGFGGSAGVMVTLRDLTERRQAEQRLQLAAELDSAIAIARLLADLHAAAPGGRDAVFAQLGRITGHLGWRDAVLNLRTPEGYRVVWATGSQVARELVGARYTQEEFAPYLEARFARGGCFYIPEELDPVPGLASTAAAAHADGETGEAPPSARPGDLLLLPLRRPDGRPLAIVSLDRSRSGQRPTDTELELLTVIAEHATRSLLREVPPAGS